MSAFNEDPVPGPHHLLPQVMAAVRILAITALRLSGANKRRRALRHHARNATCPLATYAIT